MKKIFVFNTYTNNDLLVELSALAETEEAARAILKSELLLDTYQRPTETGFAMMKWDHRMIMKVRVSEALIETMPLKLTIPDSYVNEFNVHLCKDDRVRKDTEDTLDKLKNLQETLKHAPEPTVST